jgi:hypothetical protein
LQCSIPSTTGFNKITRSFRTRENSLALSVSRACGPEHLRASQQKQSQAQSPIQFIDLRRLIAHRTVVTSACDHTSPPLREADPLKLRPAGPNQESTVARGISTYLKPESLFSGPPLCVRCDGSALPELATGSAPRAFPVPGGVARSGVPADRNSLRPTVGGLPPRRLSCWTSSYL